MFNHRTHIAVVVLSFFLLSACESIKVANVDVGKIYGLASGNNSGSIVDYCKANPGPCVAATLLTAATVALYVTNQDGGNCRRFKGKGRCGGGGSFK